MDQVLIAAATILAAAGNLLANGGFEAQNAGVPDRWDVFVAPQPGALGLVDDAEPFEGRYCIRLHNPRSYEVEPANNWSQPIYASLGGKRLYIQGHIKTDDVTEAAIWVQCFRRNPGAILNQVSSSIDAPVHGTMPWTEVKFAADIPEGTDFVMVRCVLKGHGTAWFDALSVSVGETPPEGLDDGRPTVSEKPMKIDLPTQPIGASEPIRIAKPVESPEIVAPTNESKAAGGPPNEELVRQLSTLQSEIGALRSEIADLREKEQKQSTRRPPPLVPHGYVWQEDQP